MRLLGLVLLFCCLSVAQVNLVPNGDFEQDADGDGIPDFWTTAGAPHVKQQLLRDVGRNGKGFSGKLTCTEFGNGTPASHAMICQVGTIRVQRGRWYRLNLWAKGQGIRMGTVRLALVNTRVWSDVGLQDVFAPTNQWQRYEFFFQATSDLPEKESRLQIWFNSTGTLWLDDVELVEIPALSPQRLPQISTEGVTNFLPNSSFECGTAGWGSYAPDLRWWMGNVFQLIGELDGKTAAHGNHSLKISLNRQNLPTFYFDWFDPVRQNVLSLVTVHHGWVPIKSGQPYTLSVFMKAENENTSGLLFVRQSDGRSLRKDFTLTKDWQRYTFTFTPQSEFVWVGAGLDLALSKTDAATVWIDALQLESGTKATPYKPRCSIEVMASTDEIGNIFAADSNRPNISLKLRAFADKTVSKKTLVKVSIKVNDFFDEEVLRRDVTLNIPAGESVTKRVNLPVGKFGFYRVQLSMPDKANFCLPLRCAVIKPYREKDSRWGMNHAYPWQFLLRLAHKAGILWWRDWSVQWRTVQPKPSADFDFTETDFQIDRVVKEGGKALILFPFPSAEWSTSGDPAQIERVQPVRHRQQVMLLACKPKDEKAFERYIAASVRHYRGKVTAYHIFNEPLYTFYSLPASLGHTLDDYLRLLRIAYKAIKLEQPDAIVVGGIGIWADNRWTREFVGSGGLKLVDALDLHLYSSGSPEALCEPLQKLWEQMKQQGELKPIWLTELGCYADDDPSIAPLKIFFGDAAMRSAFQPDERTASEWLVKFAALFFANGGEKIFLHAGTCGEINGVDTGSVFFEYGGAPRKLYAAVAAMANLLPPEAKFERKEGLGKGAIVYWFRNGKKRVGVVWALSGTQQISLTPGLRALDIMGNQIESKKVKIGAIPIYLTH
ncbi:MAG: phage head spike fiber domain-containing protein [Candidatus Fervidibacter sp.]|uniref:phage head spike fiber domain-containing protein n=1 Tax=Candidatus Fervidibacter sp. TaxID=3100871 RepID=UPI00404B8604